MGPIVAVAAVGIGAAAILHDSSSGGAAPVVPAGCSVGAVVTEPGEATRQFSYPAGSVRVMLERDFGQDPDGGLAATAQMMEVSSPSNRTFKALRIENGRSELKIVTISSRIEAGQVTFEARIRVKYVEVRAVYSNGSLRALTAGEVQDVTNKLIAG